MDVHYNIYCDVNLWLLPSDVRSFSENLCKYWLFKVGMTNGDYMAIIQQILMPVAYEVRNELK